MRYSSCSLSRLPSGSTPAIDQADYIRRQGFKVKEARWERDNLYRLQAGGAFHAVEKMPLLK